MSSSLTFAQHHQAHGRILQTSLSGFNRLRRRSHGRSRTSQRNAADHCTPCYRSHGLLNHSRFDDFSSAPCNRVIPHAHPATTTDTILSALPPTHPPSFCTILLSLSGVYRIAGGCVTDILCCRNMANSARNRQSGTLLLFRSGKTGGSDYYYFTYLIIRTGSAITLHGNRTGSSRLDRGISSTRGVKSLTPSLS